MFMETTRTHMYHDNDSSYINAGRKIIICEWKAMVLECVLVDIAFQIISQYRLKSSIQAIEVLLHPSQIGRNTRL